VVVDTLAASAPVSLTAVATVRNTVLAPVLAFAKDTGAGVLLLHHTTKAGEIAGSKALVDGLRQVLTLTASPADPRRKAVHVHKSASVDVHGTGDVPFALAGAGLGARVEWLADIGQYRGRGPAGDGQARVLLLLRNATRPMTAQEIAARTGIPYGTVRVLLSRLGQRGLVSSPSRNSFVA
jgi:DNA-binding transcriptional ArsR family regulator